MAPILLRNILIHRPVYKYELCCPRFFSGRRARRVSRDQLTSQENLLLQQKLRELQLQQLQLQPRKQGFMSIIRDGLLHGIGWSFAQRIVDSIFGPRTLNISDFTGHHTDTGSDMPDLKNDSGMDSPFAEDNGQDEGWSWGSDLFSDDE